jgi:ATP-binding cassette subfamily B protein
MAIEGSAERVGQWQAVKDLTPHLWSRIGWDLRARVGAAVACLVVAKLANVYVPILFKAMVDALTPHVGTGAATGASVAIAVPIGLLIAYGLARIATQVFSELRDGIFARVAQRAIRNVALETFRHLHALSLKFHLDRQTGGLTRAIERGAKGIEFLLSFVLFNVLPTMIEIALV